MIRNYIIIALRNLIKNRLYAIINVVGLSIGLIVYVFGSVLVDYEHTHDQSFTAAERIYTLSSIRPDRYSLKSHDAVYSAFGPIVEASIDDVEAVSRTVNREFLISIGDDDYYQDIRFVDPAFTSIFNLNYISGGPDVLNQPTAILITESLARRYFGERNPVGKIISLDHKNTLTVGAVVEDLPQNTHFNSSLVSDQRFEIVAPLTALSKASGFPLEGNWNDLSGGNYTYVLAREDHDYGAVQAQVDRLYDEHYPDNSKQYVAGVGLNPISAANTSIWTSTGLPVMQSLQILATLVLVVACVNYTNLAIAQSLGRVREVGLRRTLGAKRSQLLVQFIAESLVIASIAMVLAVTALELIIPVFNEALGKVMMLDYAEVAPWLVTTTLLVGLLSGIYPAFHISRIKPTQSLAGGLETGTKGGLVRSWMIGVQFAISIFMLAIVLVMYFQNEKIKDALGLYPADQLVILSRLNVDGVGDKLETLREELKRHPNVKDFALSSHVPFDQSNSDFNVAREPGDRPNAFPINYVRIDYSFLDVFEIPLLAGRNLQEDIASDRFGAEDGVTNVLVNELAAKKLGFASAQDAIGQAYYDFPSGTDPRRFTIVGVVEDQNFLGFHNQLKPYTFLVNGGRRYATIRVSPANIDETLADIRSIWDEQIPDYPIQLRFLDDVFESVYKIFRAVNQAFASFAVLALVLAFIGLFGLAAFMAERRTKEIGIRKVVGASSLQIVALLIWKFSRPVIWALAVALPLAFFGSGLYLDFFTDRIGLPVGIIASAGVASVIISWLIVGLHAARVANANPINALRYE